MMTGNVKGIRFWISFASEIKPIQEIRLIGEFPEVLVAAEVEGAVGEGGGAEDGLAEF